ncbi:MAG: polysaccharide deacetylase family protein [Salibacteraceae bacterium]
MTPYKWSRILFLTIFLLSGGLWHFGYLHFSVLIVLPAAYLIFLSWAVFQIERNLFLTSINYSDSSPAISITFDDGPNPDHTPQILETLKKHNVKAAFFCIGKNVESHPELAKRIFDEGHILANHSYSHDKWIDFNNKMGWLDEMNQSNKAIKTICGKTPRYFRPPYGITTPHLRKALLSSSMMSIGWNVRSLDTLNNNVSEIIERCMNQLKKGSIVLFHDNLSWSAEVLDKFLIEAKNQKFEVQRLDELINKKAYD